MPKAVDLTGKRFGRRKCSRNQNQWNMRRHARKQRSRFKGVNYRDASGRWYAAIVANGVYHGLGTHDSEEAAALAYDEAARRLHGEFARVNFPAPHEQGALA